MEKRHELIPSQEMGRRMHLWRYGHFGPPLLVFPSAAGFAHEWEAHGVVESLADLIDGGRLKLYCTESNVAEAWTRHESPPEWRIRRHMAFESYVVSELVPFIRADCRQPDVRLGAAGVSLGAFYAANFALKHAEIFRWVLCMSGMYQISDFTDGFQNADVYFNNPMAYLPNLEGEALERVRRNTHVVLVCGQGMWEDSNVEQTRAFADLLACKGISHEQDIWGRDSHHQWDWWTKQVRHHIGRALATA